MAHTRIVYYPIRIVEAEVPGWFYVDGHLGPGCYRREDLVGMTWKLPYGKVGMYELHEVEPARRGPTIPPGPCKVWYVGVAGEYPYEGVVFSVDDPGLFPDSMMPANGALYYPPRGLFAQNSLRAAIDFMAINGMAWAERVITSRQNGHILTVTYHHVGGGKYSRSGKKKRREKPERRPARPLVLAHLAG